MIKYCSAYWEGDVFVVNPQFRPNETNQSQSPELIEQQQSESELEAGILYRKVIRHIALITHASKLSISDEEKNELINLLKGLQNYSSLMKEIYIILSQIIREQSCAWLKLTTPVESRKINYTSVAKDLVQHLIFKQWGKSNYDAFTAEAKASCEGMNKWSVIPATASKVDLGINRNQIVMLRAIDGQYGFAICLTKGH